MSVTDQSGKGPTRKLGRGLSALLGTPVQIQATRVMQEPAASSGIAPLPVPPREQAPTPIETPRMVEQDEGAASMLRQIPVEQIVPNRRQPRTDFDEAALSSLAASIKQAGLMQPVMVRPSAQGFELVAGERRWRAAKLIGLATIPALVREIDEQTAAELALIENVQREDLNPMERAYALRRLSSDFSLTHQDIADRVGLDRASVSNLLRLADLDKPTADLVRRGKLSQGHAKALLAISDLGLRAELAAKTMAGDWSVRELERQVQQAGKGKPSLRTAAPAGEVNARSANVADLERQLAEYLGTRVAIQLGRKKGSGRLIVDFYNLDQFDGLMSKMGFGNR
ncbi:MAG: ParB/RepB/Spo0J family partition protein [Planctomycetaceae bacterium]|nr:ParB/RepB/Spo0J family partition protein [Planctomycetaceae bacterium]